MDDLVDISAITVNLLKSLFTAWLCYGAMGFVEVCEIMDSLQNCRDFQLLQAVFTLSFRHTCDIKAAENRETIVGGWSWIYLAAC